MNKPRKMRNEEFMYTVQVPISHLYSIPALNGEHTDEALFGTECEILDDFGDFYKIKTDYQYIGWVKKTDICPALQKGGFVVKCPFADLLPTPENNRAPIITFPKGSVVDYGVPHAGERYGMVILPDKTGGYMHNQWVQKYPEKCDNFRDVIVETAKSYLGVQYRWGGKTHAGIDCSGLAFMSYFFAGINIWRDADIDRSTALKQITLSEAQKGDLLFYRGHVAVYLGDEKFIHSCASYGVCYGDFETSSSMKNNIVAIGTVK